MFLKRILILTILLVVVIFAKAKTYLIHSEAEFKNCIKQLNKGDSIIVANGKYTSWTEVIASIGSQLNPITITAETPGKVIFSDSVFRPVFQITGKYITLHGFTFRGCFIARNTGNLIELYNSSSCRITNCIFENNVATIQFRPLVVISGSGSHNKVDHCSFTSNINNQEVQVRIGKGSYPLYTLIEDNEFKDKARVTWKDQNGGECVQVGQNNILLESAEPKTMVRNNRFIRCNGDPEVISNKSSGNVYRGNYFEDCRGELVLRGGNDCVVDSNSFKGGNGGIRVNGTGHQIINNNINGTRTGIRLLYGMAKGRSETGLYIAASGCLIKNNLIENTNIGILVGENKNVNWVGKFDVNKYPSRTMQDIAPIDNQFLDNKFLNNKKDTVYQ